MRIVSTLFCEKSIKLHSGLSQLIGVFQGRISCTVVSPNQSGVMDVQIMVEHDREETIDVEFRARGLDGALLVFLPARLEFKQPLCWFEITLNNLSIPLTRSGSVVIEAHRVGTEWFEAGKLHIDVETQAAAAPVRLSA